MKIAFYLDSIKPDIDYTDPSGLNPGIGGAQFLIWSTSYYLSNRDNGIDIILFAPNGTDYSPVMKVIKVGSLEECLQQCSANHIDLLVLRGPFYQYKIVDYINKYKVKIVLWEHNFENYILEKIVQKCPNIIGNICVSNEQKDILLDSHLFSKSQVIYNGINFSEYDCIENKEEKMVCYIGNLLPYSGYNTFLRAWEIVQEKMPDARLTIIGGNGLYNMSTMKVAYSKKAYSKLKSIEDTVLRDSKGNLKDNVTFLGVLGGKNKLKAMGKATVGVANLTPAGETFGLSTVEFEALGVPVVSLDFRGTRETVSNHNSGVLAKDYLQIAESIFLLLNNEELCKNYGDNGKSFVRYNFSIEKIAEVWEMYFEKLSRKEEISRAEVIDKNRYSYDKKNIIYFNFKLRRILPFLPSHLFYERIKYIFRRIIQKAGLA